MTNKDYISALANIQCNIIRVVSEEPVAQLKGDKQLVYRSFYQACLFWLVNFKTGNKLRVLSENGRDSEQIYRFMESELRSYAEKYVNSNIIDIYNRIILEAERTVIGRVNLGDFIDVASDMCSSALQDDGVTLMTKYDLVTSFSDVMKVYDSDASAIEGLIKSSKSNEQYTAHLLDICLWNIAYLTYTSFKNAAPTNTTLLQQMTPYKILGFLYAHAVNSYGPQEKAIRENMNRTFGKGVDAVEELAKSFVNKDMSNVVTDVVASMATESEADVIGRTVPVLFDHLEMCYRDLMLLSGSRFL